MPKVDQEYLKKCKEDAASKTEKIQPFHSMQTRTMAAKHVPADLPPKKEKKGKAK